MKTPRYKGRDLNREWMLEDAQKRQGFVPPVRRSQELAAAPAEQLDLMTSERCPAPHRKGRHEVYLLRGKSICKACGRVFEKKGGQ